jgi:hypothetical protein
MLSILPLACAAAVYPTLLAGVIVMLGRPAPLPLLVGFLLGGLVMSVTLGLIIVFVIHGAVSTSHRKAVSPEVNLIAGVLSLVLAAFLWSRRDVGRLGERKPLEPPRDIESSGANPRRSAESITKRILAHGSPGTAFALGVVLNVPGIWYLVALNDIANNNRGAGAAVLLILLFNAIMFLLVEVPLVGYLISPEGTTARVKRFQRWLGEHSRLVAAVVALAVGAYLVVGAIVHLS